VYEVKTGHLIPVDASDQYASWIELKPWLERIARLPPKHILVILDACESGIALSDALLRTRDSATAIARPFVGASRRHSRLLITSASEGELALDSGPRPGHSLFTGCLIDALIQVEYEVVQIGSERILGDAKEASNRNRRNDRQSVRPTDCRPSGLRGRIVLPKLCWP